MSSTLSLAVLSLACLLSLAAEPAPSTRPTSPMATDALKKHDAALAAARAAYQKAQVDAEKQLVEDLDKSLALAMQARDLPEANRIDAAKAEAVRRRDELMRWGKAGPTTGTIVAAGSLSGSWRITYTNKATHLYAFNPDGTVERLDDKVTTRPTRDGPGMLLDFGDGKVERVTLAGDRLLIEHFITKADYPHKATIIGIGVKAPQG